MNLLSNESAIRILDAHSIPYRMNGRTIEVLDRFTVNGVYYEGWILCPWTMKRMKDWLGY